MFRNTSDYWVPVAVWIKQIDFRGSGPYLWNDIGYEPLKMGFGIGFLGTYDFDTKSFFDPSQLMFLK